MRPSTTLWTSAAYSPSLTVPAQGQVATPSWAGVHGPSRGAFGGRAAQRRMGTADSMASATSRAAAVDGSGAR